MKTICLYFEIHQIIHLKRYRFFDIGTDHYYYDDYENERSINYIAEHSYMPALDTLLQMIKENGDYFKVAFSISGVGMEQLEVHAPQVLDKLQQLNNTGCVEFLAEPYSHGLSSLANAESFAADVKKQSDKMTEYFGRRPTVLRNSSEDMVRMYGDGLSGMVILSQQGDLVDNRVLQKQVEILVDNQKTLHDMGIKSYRVKMYRVLLFAFWL